MAHLKRINAVKKSKTGEQASFQGAITVTTDGVFGVTVPEYLNDIACALQESVPGSYVRNAKGIVRLYSDKLDTVHSMVDQMLTLFLECEEKTELVIAYAHSLEVSYYLDSDGNIQPNGYFGSRNGDWKGRLNASSNQANMYRIGMVAGVFEKTTYTRKTGSKVVYASARYGIHDIENPAAKLNAFTGLGLFKPNEKTLQLPYSDEAALFFIDVMTGMCRLADRMESFFGDKENIQKAIESKLLLLS